MKTTLHLPTLIVCLLTVVSCTQPDSAGKTPKLVNPPQIYQAQELPNNNPLKNDEAIAKLEIVEPLAKKEKETPTPNLDALYMYLDRPAQKFQVDPTQLQEIKCEEGTVIKLPANCLVDASTGEPVSGKVDVYITEYYQSSDLLAANLSTMAGNRILETGGTIHIEAFSNGSQCEIKKGAAVELGFPCKEEKEGMETFVGNWENSKMNWVQLDTATSMANNLFIEEEDEESEGRFITCGMTNQMPQFPGGEAELFKFLNKNIKYPQCDKDSGIQGTVYLQFTVTGTGDVTDGAILRGVSPGMDSAALSVLDKMPKWTPGTENGKIGDSRFNLPIRFRCKGCQTMNTGYNAGLFEKRATEKGIGSTSASALSQYMLSSSSLGWINCDRFYRDNKPKTDLYIASSNEAQMDVKLVFHNIRSVLPGYLSRKGYSFYNVPEDEDVTIIAVKKQDGKHLIAIKESNTSIKNAVLAYEEVSFEQIKSKMNELAALWE